MAPPGGIQGGGGSGYLTGRLPLPPPPEESTVIESEGRTVDPSETEVFERHTTLRGKVVLVVFNPAAKDGRIAAELPQLVSALEADGANVVTVETHPEEAVRWQRIYDATRGVLSGEKGKVSSVIVLPYGGDVTIWDTVREVLRATGADLALNQIPPESLEILQRRLSFALAKKGTASDNPVQVGAPSRPGEIPRYIRHAVFLPYRPPIIEIPTGETPRFELAGHSFSFGIGGDIFARRDRARAANPTLWRNQGLQSYLRQLFPAIRGPWGKKGVEVELRHFDREGNLINSATRRGAENMVTPNRIMAGVSGIPGEWGNTKVMILPPRLRGFLAMTEYLFRGLGTKLGFNLVGPGSRVRMLAKENQWEVRPGERIELYVKGSEKAPTIRNGDSVAPVERFVARVPEYTIQMAAAPESLAVRLARASALAKGETPPVLDKELVEATLLARRDRAQHRRHSLVRGAESIWRWLNPFPEKLGPQTLEHSESRTTVQTEHFSEPRMQRLLARHSLTPQNLPRVLMGAHQWYHHSGLEGIGRFPVPVESVQEFLESPDRTQWHLGPSTWQGAMGERVIEGGVPLAAGIAALFGAEALADSIGLDPVLDRELRFGMVIYLSHMANANVAPLWEVIANRTLLNRPYDFVRNQSLRVAGENFSRMTLSRSATVPRALAASWTTGSLGLGMGLHQSVGRRALHLGTLPVRAAWNMGHGLIFSRITQSLLSGLPEDSSLRHHAPTAAFFLPEVGQLLAPRFTTSLLHNRLMKPAARVFAAGFIADMGFDIVNKWRLGDRAGYELSLQHRAAAMRRERGGIPWYSWRNPIGFIAPSLAAHINTHRYGFGEENSYMDEIRNRDREISRQIQGALIRGLPRLAQRLNMRPHEVLSERIELSFLEDRMLRQIRFRQSRNPQEPEPSFDERVVYLRQQFSGHDLTQEDAQRHLARIYASQLQESLTVLHQIDLPENLPYRVLFDEHGRLYPGQEGALNHTLGITS